MKIQNKEALSVFLTDAEMEVEVEAKKLGQEFLPGLIARLQIAEENIKVKGFGTWFEKIGEEALTDVAEAALAWCNTSEASGGEALPPTKGTSNTKAAINPEEGD